MARERGRAPLIQGGSIERVPSKRGVLARISLRAPGVKVISPAGPARQPVDRRGGRTLPDRRALGANLLACAGQGWRSRLPRPRQRLFIEAVLWLARTASLGALCRRASASGTRPIRAFALEHQKRLAGLFARLARTAHANIFSRTESFATRRCARRWLARRGRGMRLRPG